MDHRCGYCCGWYPVLQIRANRLICLGSIGAGFASWVGRHEGHIAKIVSGSRLQVLQSSRHLRFWPSWIENQESSSVLIKQTYALLAERRLQEGTRGFDAST